MRKMRKMNLKKLYKK
jgi:hypothetical protein